MLSIDDWMGLLNNLFTKAEDKGFSRDRYVIADRRDIFSTEAIRIVNEKNIKVTIVWLLKRWQILAEANLSGTALNYRYIAYALILAAVGLFMAPSGDSWIIIFLVPLAIADHPFNTLSPKD